MPELIINIAQGDLQGCLCTTDEGFQYNSYMGIPYAKPPIGNLRFQDPQPAEGWSGIRDATFEREINPQVDRLFTQQFMGDEDSLFLNVHTPADAHEGSHLAVMVWIHGGAFIMGSGNKLIFGPDFLVQTNVIVVTLNYRLGPFGFLCLHTPEVSGNAGLKDQVMALEWVQNNIHRFGGNRDSVTVFGESAGSASIHYLTMSPLAKNLFHRAIMQSGAATSSWASQSDPEKSAFALGEKMGLKTTDKDELLKFFREQPAKDLVMASYLEFNTGTAYNFTPVVEKEHPNVKPFMTTSPLEALTSGNFSIVPSIMGFNSQEGVLLIAKQLMGDIDLSKLKTIEDFGFDFEIFLPAHLKLLDSEKKSELINKIKDLYFQNDNHVVDNYINMMSDIVFVLDIDNSAKLMSHANGELYYYKFSYNGGLNIYKSMVNYSYTGAAHGDDLGYLFKLSIDKLIEMKNDPSIKVTISPSDIVTVKRIVELWTNFAKVGLPTLRYNDLITTKWEPMTKDDVNCLDIGVDMKMIKDPFSDRMKLWSDVFKSLQMMKS